MEGVEEKVVESVAEVAVQTKTMLHLDELMAYLTWGNLMKVVVAFISVLVFYVVYRIIKHIIKKQAAPRVEKHTYMLINKFVSYVFYVIIVMYILSLFGINLKAIWGAAGVAGLAIGFAAQTSVSNLISGIFVLSEKAMKVGDFIQVGDVFGTVDSVGLLSVRVHTLDNQMVRIPNSSVINSNLVNFNHYDIRRFVFDMPISYDSNMEKALEVANSIPGKCPVVLQNPVPCVYFDGFGDAINIKIAVWFNCSDLINAKNQMYAAIVNTCREQGIEIPYTHYDVKILNK
ncbi:mechanosensitive ion channel family protein [Treponema sp.]|uniref:mechanosensitive ion channel family protein n=1 Tax=Treponema sp. TaxID=166 RepID=UPI002A828C0F|nr:mechanosensitive ion channel family protein [Treponema sp.]MCI6443194.1 mechanosensitive ion channel family protein [Spirochaetia bacterium]MDY4132889.1 mechanosensitive ion channel family protein [Treponema sp.]